eukprot:6037109-Prymnesium_polylepis.1
MSTFGFPCHPVLPRNEGSPPPEPDAPTHVDSAPPSTDAESDLQNKVRELLIELKIVTNGGTQFELAVANKMDKDAFFAYKETLKQCKPRFRFDRDGTITGYEK